MIQPEYPPISDNCELGKNGPGVRTKSFNSEYLGIEMNRGVSMCNHIQQVNGTSSSSATIILNHQNCSEYLSIFKFFGDDSVDPIFARD